jgi:hypothetical protein
VKPTNAVEIDEEKAKSFPPFVIEAFNNLILKNWNGLVSYVHQEDVIEEIIKLGGIERRVIFDNNWLNIQSTYRREGWFVKYDKTPFVFLWEFRKRTTSSPMYYI